MEAICGTIYVHIESIIGAFDRELCHCTPVHGDSASTAASPSLPPRSRNPFSQADSSSSSASRYLSDDSSPADEEWLASGGFLSKNSPSIAPPDGAVLNAPPPPKIQLSFLPQSLGRVAERDDGMTAGAAPTGPGINQAIVWKIHEPRHSGLVHQSSKEKREKAAGCFVSWRVLPSDCSELSMLHESVTMGEGCCTQYASTTVDATATKSHAPPPPHDQHHPRATDPLNTQLPALDAEILSALVLPCEWLLGSDRCNPLRMMGQWHHHETDSLAYVAAAAHRYHQGRYSNFVAAEFPINQHFSSAGAEVVICGATAHPLRSTRVDIASSIPHGWALSDVLVLRVLRPAPHKDCHVGHRGGNWKTNPLLRTPRFQLANHHDRHPLSATSNSHQPSDTTTGGASRCNREEGQSPIAPRRCDAAGESRGTGAGAIHRCVDASAHRTLSGGAELYLSYLLAPQIAHWMQQGAQQTTCTPTHSTANSRGVRRRSGGSGSAPAQNAAMRSMPRATIFSKTVYLPIPVSPEQKGCEAMMLKLTVQFRPGQRTAEPF